MTGPAGTTPAADRQAADDPLLDVVGVKKYFPVPQGLAFRKRVTHVKAVDDVSFRLDRGETLGLVGESGCGKTTLGRCILQLERPTAGQIRFEGTNLAALKEHALRPLRRKMQVIFQDPYSALNPRQKVGAIIAEPMKVHGIEPDGRRRRERVAELLGLCGLGAEMAQRYPHELSGGQRQRVGIARALSLQPALIICDEPVSALDVSIQAQIINLLESLRDSLHLAYLFIAHDLSVVRHLCHRVAVMYLARSSNWPRATRSTSIPNIPTPGRCFPPSPFRTRRSRPNSSGCPSPGRCQVRSIRRAVVSFTRVARWPWPVAAVRRRPCGRPRPGIGWRARKCEREGWIIV